MLTSREPVIRLCIRRQGSTAESIALKTYLLYYYTEVFKSIKLTKENEIQYSILNSKHIYQVMTRHRQKVYIKIGSVRALW